MNLGAGKSKRSSDGCLQGACELQAGSWHWGGVPELAAFPVREAAGSQDPYGSEKEMLQSEFIPKCNTGLPTSASPLGPQTSPRFKTTGLKSPSFVTA